MTHRSSNDQLLKHISNTISVDETNKHCGKIAPLIVTCGTVHYYYLEMKIDFSERDKVISAMYDCINKILENLPNDMQGMSVTSVQSHLFKIDETNTNKLDDATSDIIHHYVEQLLFMSKYAQHYLQTAVAFL